MKMFGAALVFFAELGMLAGFAMGGWELGGVPGLVAGLAVCAGVGAFWGMFLAPRARKPLSSDALAVTLRLTLLFAGAVAAWLGGVEWLAIFTAAAASLGTLLAGRTD